MRIAQLIDSLTVGGAQKLQVTFARAIRDRGAELTVATLFPSRTGDIDAELGELGVEVVALHGRSLFDPLRAGRLVRFLRRGGFDVLFTHLTSANILGPIAGRIARIPVIATLHSVQRIPIRGALETLTLRGATTRVVAVGDAVAEAHRARLRGAQCVVIPNPVGVMPSVPPDERRELRQALIGGKEFMLVSTGRLRPVKGYPDLLKAFADLLLSHPEAALVIAGAGPMEEQLREQIRDMGLRGDAHLVGFRSDVARLLAAADGFVSASHWEGLPLSLLEAMAAGLPVVATDVGEVRKVVVGGTGLLVPPKAPEALASALRSLLSDRERARTMGAAGQRHVRQHYTVDKWADRLFDLADSVSR